MRKRSGRGKKILPIAAVTPRAKRRNKVKGEKWENQGDPIRC